MLIEAARRAEAAAKETLALVNDGSASCAQLRDVLAVLKSTAAAVSAAQTSAAASIAGRERHGDGGADLLAAAAGMTRGQARGRVNTAATLRKVPVLAEAVQSGRVPQANARHLAAAVNTASAGAVASDEALLAAAESMRPEHFSREARRWAADRCGDDGVGEHQRQRARRRLRIFDGDDGMVHLHGEFDKVTGTRVANRLRRQARCLLDADKTTPGTARRSFDQCMADALDSLTHNGAATTTHHGTTGRGNTGPGRGTTTGSNGVGDGSGTTDHSDDGTTGGVDGGATGDSGSTAGTSGSTTGAGSTAVGGRPAADICVMVHTDDDTAKLVAELPDRTRLPRRVLDALSCDAAIAGVICDRQGSPIWRSYASRGATDAQKQILYATYGGCFNCGTNPGVCQIHHIEPVWAGGRTEINNLVPVCWGCHDLIHEHRWWILKRTLGKHTMHPPDGPRHGPAHQPDHPTVYRKAGSRSADHPRAVPAASAAAAEAGSTDRSRRLGHRETGQSPGAGRPPGPPHRSTPADSAPTHRGPPHRDGAQREPALF